MFTLAAFRNAASPALRAWIDANAIDVLHAAAPANVGFLDPKIAAVAEKVRNGVGSSGWPAKALQRIADGIGIEAHSATEDVPVRGYQGRTTMHLSVREADDYAQRFRLRGTRVVTRGTAYDGAPYVELDVTDAEATVPVVVVTIPGESRLLYTVSSRRGGVDLLRPPFTDYDLQEHTATPDAKALAAGRAAALSTQEARALVSAWLNKVTPDEERARKARAQREAALRDKEVGSCPVCFRLIGLKRGTLTTHGYEMSGYRGYGHAGMYRATRDCHGTGYVPWEVSSRGAADYAGALRAEAAQDDEWAAKREAREIQTPFRMAQGPRGGRGRLLGTLELPGRDETLDLIEFGDPRWEKLNTEQVALARKASAQKRALALRYDLIVSRWPIPAFDAAQIVNAT